MLKAQVVCNRLTSAARQFLARKMSNKKKKLKKLKTLTESQCKEAARTSSAEIAQAELELIKRIQRRYLSKVLHDNCKSLQNSHPLAQYHPFIDPEGLLRCRSRLERSTTHSYDEKFPIIIPSEDNWAKLLIQWVHATQCWHWGGVANTLHRFRERFFVLKARRLAHDAVRTCPGCKRFNAKPAMEPTAPLPAFRVEESPVFYFCGVDFAGP